MISFDEFLKKVDQAYNKYSSNMRYGQTIMNVLHDISPIKYEELVATENDCFYDDRMVNLTLAKLKKEW